MDSKKLQTIARTLHVTAYHDYRDYLADLYERYKSESATYSYLVFAEDLGFSAINMLRLVISKQRLLSPKSAQTIVKNLNLRKAERKYFLAMVNHINARSQKLRDEYFRRMLDAKQESIVSHLDKNQMEYYASWQNAIVHEMLRLDGVDKTALGISAALEMPVSEDKVRRAMALLESIGLVAIDPATGVARRLKDSPMIMPSDATAGHLAIIQYHQGMIDLSREALAKVPAAQREFNALTLAVSVEGFQQVAAKLRDLCAELMTLENADQKREVVAQVNIQLFSLSTWSKP